MSLAQTGDVAPTRSGDYAPPKVGPRTGKPLSAPGFRVSFTASLAIQDLSRDALGRFTNIQSKIIEVNQRMAIDFQNTLLRVMGEGRKRPPDGRLLRATADRRNRFP